MMKNFVFILSLLFLISVSVFAQQTATLSLLAHSAPAEITDVENLNSESRNKDLNEAEAIPGFTPPALGAVKAKSFGFDYFPLKKNVQYNYDSNAGDTEAEVSEADNELVLTYNAGSITYEQQFFKADKGIYLTRTETSAFLFFGSKVTYPEPVLRLPLPLAIGATWEWIGLEVAGGDTGKLTIKGEALGEENIETPFGRYTCLKIQMRVESEMGSRNTITEWLAPNIGVVKFHAELEGSGITGFLQDIMGLDEITFNLTGLKDKKI